MNGTVFVLHLLASITCIL